MVPGASGARFFRRHLPAAGLLAALAMVLLSLYGARAAPPGTPAFQRTWERTDLAVRDGVTARTWMWGPEANTSVLQEPYADAPGGQRNVQYFDKARMEDNSYRADGPPWDVTNGLLVVELITGRMQLGDDIFEQRQPARVNVAGDADDDNGPQYATFAALLDSPPAAPGTLLTKTVSREGVVSQDDSLAAAGVTVAVIDDVTNHAIAAPFWEFMNSTGTVYANGVFTTEALFENPYFATG
ncbi:MAG TPA: hypothetical protein VKZ96_12345, partial [Thermomicrobiales bacterium]|nr:hypothetical protein [Thermomicrobiales bacterium]